MSNFGWETVFKLYTRKKFWEPSKRPLTCTLVVLPVFIFSTQTSLFFISEITNLIITIIPNVLGFLLGGYALLMGFSGSNIVETMSKSKDNKPTLYQKQNTVFAVALFALFIGLVAGLIVELILKAQIIVPLPYADYLPIEQFNYGILSLLCYILFYAVFAIKDMVINVFNFGQLIHLKIKGKIS